jgi:hypothetical protein
MQQWLTARLLPHEGSVRAFESPGLKHGRALLPIHIRHSGVLDRKVSSDCLHHRDNVDWFLVGLLE